jgi:hypothetical protein
LFVSGGTRGIIWISIFDEVTGDGSIEASFSGDKWIPSRKSSGIVEFIS